jgi:glycosyltransferase involved in cell wall biosynthesis
MWRLLAILRSKGWELSFHPLDGPTPRLAAERLRGQGVELLAPGLGALESHLGERPEPEVALVSGPHAGEQVMPVLRRAARGTAIFYDTVDLAHLRAFRQAKATGNRGVLRDALKLKGLEMELTRNADVAVAVSDVERTILSEAVPETEVVVVPFVHVGGDGRPPPRSARRPEIVMVGYWPHPPNQSAARLLLDYVWPALAGRDPELRLVLIGALPPDWLSEAAAAGGGRILVTGHVPDVAPFLESAWCSVAPLLFGSGVKGKVLSSLAHGLPTVGTSIAWEGIPIVDGVHGLVADDPEAMVEGVERLRSDPELWDRLNETGPRLVAEHFSFAAARAAIVDALGRALARAEART